MNTPQKQEYPTRPQFTHLSDRALARYFYYKPDATEGERELAERLERIAREDK